MKVRDLIEELEVMDQDAEVLIMIQENWPFECDLHGVVKREDFNDEDDEDGGDYGDGLDPSDVFLVQGSQLRYGSKRAWNL